MSRFVIFLAIGDFGWAIVEIIAYVILIVDVNLYGNSLCVAGRLLFQFFSGSTIFWTLSIAVFLYRGLVMESNTQISGAPLSSLQHSSSSRELMKNYFDINSNFSMWPFHLVSWGIPFLQCVAVSPFLQQDSDQRICLPREPFHLLFWFAPLILAIIIAIIIYVILMFKLSQTLSKSAGRYSIFSFITESSTFANASVPIGFRLATYILVFIFCWTLNILTYLLQYVYSNCTIFVLLVIADTLLQLQGFLDCVVYGLTNKQLRRVFLKLTLINRFGIVIFAPILVPYSLLYFIYRQLYHINVDTDTNLLS